MNCEETLHNVYVNLRGAAEDAKKCNVTLSINAALVGTPAGLLFLGDSLQDLGHSEDGTARGVVGATQALQCFITNPPVLPAKIQEVHGLLAKAAQASGLLGEARHNIEACMALSTFGLGPAALVPYGKALDLLLQVQGVLSV